MAGCGTCVKTHKRAVFGVIVVYVVLLLVLYPRLRRTSSVSQAAGSRPAQPARAVRVFFSDSVIDVNMAATKQTDHHHHHQKQKPRRAQDQAKPAQTPEEAPPIVAVGGALTSKGVKDVTPENIPRKFQLLTSLLPSFCSTASRGYEYRFYFAFDDTDDVLANRGLLAAFSRHFSGLANRLCAHLGGKPPEVYFVRCTHTAHPAWAQNDAMMQAYLDGADYFYRVNDDSVMGSRGWTDSFIKALRGYDPLEVGVVGPRHVGGNLAILTYDFVHRSHVDVFGFYYPRLFTTWWADDWITKVYQPGRSTKLSSVALHHTMKLGQRYDVDFSVSTQVSAQIEADKRTLQRYLLSRERASRSPSDGHRVVSMALWGGQPARTLGAVRNAQLMSVYYPGWTLRVYVTGNITSTMAVPARVLTTLERLGAQIAIVSAPTLRPSLWPLLVADDRSVDTFLVRDPRARISDRERQAVSQWLKQDDAVVHCMRDHPLHTGGLVSGLWGARAGPLRERVDVLDVIHKQAPSDILPAIWHAVRDASVCHDSVTCQHWPRSRPFPSKRPNHSSYVGRRYDENQLPVKETAPEVPLPSEATRCYEGPEDARQWPEWGVQPASTTTMHDARQTTTPTTGQSNYTASSNVAASVPRPSGNPAKSSGSASEVDVMNRGALADALDSSKGVDGDARSVVVGAAQHGMSSPKAYPDLVADVAKISSVAKLDQGVNGARKVTSNNPSAKYSDSAKLATKMVQAAKKTLHMTKTPYTTKIATPVGMNSAVKPTYRTVRDSKLNHTTTVLAGRS